MLPTQAHSAKPKDLHFLLLKFVSAFLMPCSRLRLCPSGCSTPCKVSGSTWRQQATPKSQNLKEKIDWTSSFSSQKGWWQIHRFTLTKKNLTFKTFINPNRWPTGFWEKCFFHDKKTGFSFPGMRSIDIFAPPKKTHQDLWPPKPIYKAPAMGNNSNFLGGVIRPYWRVIKGSWWLVIP